MSLFLTYFCKISESALYKVLFKKLIATFTSPVDIGSVGDDRDMPTQGYSCISTKVSFCINMCCHIRFALLPKHRSRRHVGHIQRAARSKKRNSSQADKI